MNIVVTTLNSAQAECLVCVCVVCRVLCGIISYLFYWINLNLRVLAQRENVPSFLPFPSRSPSNLSSSSSPSPSPFPFAFPFQPIIIFFSLSLSLRVPFPNFFPSPSLYSILFFSFLLISFYSSTLGRGDWRWGNCLSEQQRVRYNQWRRIF